MHPLMHHQLLWRCGLQELSLALVLMWMCPREAPTMQPSAHEVLP